MARKHILTVVAMIAMVAMVVAGCTTPTPEPEPRTTGPFLDEVLVASEPEAADAIQQLKNDTMDVYAYGMANASLYAEVLAAPGLTSVSNLDLYYELTSNPVGPTFPATGKLNPFSDSQFREAMHWLIDRDYIAGDIMGGLAVPRFTCLHPQGADATQRFSDIIADLVAEYDHNQTRATTVIGERMTALGAQLVDGKWNYNAEPVEIIGLIRTEDQRKDIGDYFADLLEGAGFTVTRHYGTSAELAPIWLFGDPALGNWHFYTGGWVSTRIPRDESDNFGNFYTPLPWLGNPLWEAYDPDPAFYEAAEKLYNFEYASMEERADLFEVCLPMSMADNVRMFLFSRKAFSPVQADVVLAHDYAGGIVNSWMWALTAHFIDDEAEPIVGGSMRIGTGDILTEPWNPVAGTNWVYDMVAIRATGDMGHWPDTRTGLRWPGRIETAEILAEPGVPIEVTNTEWCKLTFVPEVQVPLDAWADWDATQQSFITVQEKYGSAGTTAKTKSVSCYSKDIFDIPLHDGSTLSMGDFILYTILMFDRGKQASLMYDEAYASQFEFFMSMFKGVKFVTDDPDYGLIVEYYSDQFQLDAELTVTTMFPFYSQGPGLWHTIALGVRAEEDGVLAFSEPKSDALGVKWISFVGGPSLAFLRSYLTSAKATKYIPYEPTVGQYVTETEAAERWSNLERWYGEKGHFWVGSGPFCLESVDTTEEVIHLKRFENYPDPMDQWLFLLDPLS
jgi:peptide/nickel transport system substrate-binding protein